MTHHSPGDVEILHSLPGMQIIVPGTASEFDRLFRETYANGSPTYYRLASTNNPVEYPVRFGKLEIVQCGSQATVIAVGPMLAATREAVRSASSALPLCLFQSMPLGARTRDGIVLMQRPSRACRRDPCSCIPPVSLLPCYDHTRLRFGVLDQVTISKSEYEKLLSQDSGGYNTSRNVLTVCFRKGLLSCHRYLHCPLSMG